jgi:hypothetical protein
MKKFSISDSTLQEIENKVITSDLLMIAYENSDEYTCIELPDSANIYFITSPTIINQITRIESYPENKNTIRTQIHTHNKRLLCKNPVSLSAIDSENYVKAQADFFLNLVDNIDVESIVFCSSSENNIVDFVTSAVAQTYLANLLEVSPSQIVLSLDKIIELINLLERATGKYDITFGDFLMSKQEDLSKDIETQYIVLFYKLLCELKNGGQIDISIPDTSSQCSEIVRMMTGSHILKVLTSVIDPICSADIVVNNMLSWIDNMLNIVHTVVNFIVLNKNNDFNRQQYFANLPVAKALTTLFMRKVVSSFTVDSISFKAKDVIMMANSNIATVFGGSGRKCPSKTWSIVYMEKLLIHIFNQYLVVDTSDENEIECEIINTSWFWNKLDSSNTMLKMK